MCVCVCVCERERGGASLGIFLHLLKHFFFNTRYIPIHRLADSATVETPVPSLVPMEQE